MKLFASVKNQVNNISGKICKNTFIILLLSLLTLSCGKSEPENTEPTPTPKPADKVELAAGTDTNPTVPTEGGTITISFNASTAWTAQAVNDRADAWCTVSPASGNAGAGAITITAKENTDPDERSASVNIKAGTALQTIKITQKQKDALTVTASTFEVPAEGQDINIEVKANVNVTYKISEECKDWIKYISTKAMKTSTLTFAVSKNEDLQKREGKIIIGEGALSDTIKVFQAGEAPSIVLNKSEYIAKSQGETFAIEVASNVDVNYSILHPDGSPTWLIESKTKTMSTNTYWFTAAANEEYDNREARIIFTNKDNNLSDTVRVFQLQKDAIALAKSVYEIDNKGGNISVEVAHNVDYKVTIGAEWITQVETKGLETDYLTFEVAENKEYDNREAIITFSSADSTITQELKVCQSQANAIIISQKEYILNSTGGDVTIEIRSNVDFTVENPDCSWIHEVKTKGLTTHTLNYKVDKNTTYDSRTASIVITNTKTGEKDSVVISQMQKDAIIAAKGWYVFNSNGGMLDFDILTSVDITVSIDKDDNDWIKQIETRGLETKSLHFDIAPYQGSESRIGYIRIKGGITQTTITVQQYGYNASYEEERKILMEFYKATNGDNWNNNENWGSDEHVGAWYGIHTNESGRVAAITLSENNLTGTLPEIIGNLTALTNLNLFGNQLTGSIPESIGNLTSLYILTISFNQLSGKIPESIGNLTSLESLDLKRNQLTGSIPQNIGNLTSLKFLDLRGNQLTGSIPQNIGNLTSLKSLDLGENQLTGSIPQNIGNLTSLTILSLYKNQLSGNIANIISNMSNLAQLYIEDNNFTGELPEVTKYMTAYSVNKNLFTGGIPASHIKAFEKNLYNEDGIYNTEYGWNYRIHDNNLSGKVPASMVNHKNWVAHWRTILPQNPGFGFEKVDIPAPQIVVKCYDNSFLDLGNEYSNNNYTIIFSWDPDCFWSQQYITPIYKLYKKYKGKGLGLICTTPLKNTMDEINPLTSVCKDIKVFSESYREDWNNNPMGFNTYFFLFRTGGTPYFHVVDNSGNIIFYGSGDKNSECIPQYHKNRDDIYDFVANLFGDEKYEEKDY